MALDALQAFADARLPFAARQPPEYRAPKARRPEVIVDAWRALLIDPTDGSMPGVAGPLGAAGEIGRLAYGGRTPSSRGV